jgi:hypothetical protein
MSTFQEEPMNRFFTTVILIFALILISGIQNSAVAQAKKVRASLKASVSQTIGTETVLSFDYCRPGVKGRVIWGELVPFGMAPGNKYSDNKPYPWRAGANENTTFETSTAITVDGKKLAAGKYGLHMIPGEETWIVIFSKKNAEWGSYSYDEAEDALRVEVKPVKAAHQEWLRYGFEDLAGTEVVAFMHWEKLKIAFKVAVAE